MSWADVARKHGMGTTELPYEPHGTDKANHGYIAHYERLLAGREVRSLLEIGVQSGASLMMWHELLPDARIVGVEIDPACGALGLYRPGTGISLVIGNAGDPACAEVVDGDFDVIIDDNSHAAAHTAAHLDVWASRLAEGGLYVIEDAVIGSTSWIQSLDEVLAMLPAHGLTPLAVERSLVPWVAHQHYGGMMSIVFADKTCEIPGPAA